MSRVAVIGGGAAGMMAAAAAAQQRHRVCLYEKNEKLGRKLYLTGKGRCNLTNNCEVEELLQAVCVNRKFLYSAFYGMDAQSVIRFFEEAGMPTKTERGKRVFPVSDHASDVTAALTRTLQNRKVEIFLGKEVKRLHIAKEGTGQKIQGVELADGAFEPADAVIVATGGITYPSTGSTGDGYRFAREAGHQVTDLSPSLVPIETEGDWAQQMQGLSLRNVKASVYDGEEELYSGFGEMMFTHFGVSGPLILTASCLIQERLKKHPLELVIDLKPALSGEQLDRRILREFEAGKNRQLKNVLGSLFPTKLVPVMIARSQIPGDCPIHEITREQRRTLLDLTKHFSLTLLRLRGYNEAVVTRGGVSVSQINPATMESKLVKGLYFAGEVLDVDAQTGGFNLQIAWSTGNLAGSSIC